MRHACRERGQSTVEWLAISVAVIVLAGALAQAAPRVAGPIASTFGCAIQRVGVGGACGAKAPQAPHRALGIVNRRRGGIRGALDPLHVLPPRDPGGADAREALIRAGHIPPPGPMTAEEAERFLHNYERAHHMTFPAGEFLLIAGRLRQGYNIDLKPEDMSEPEWAKRLDMAMTALSLLPAGRVFKLGRYLSERLALLGVRSAAELDEEAAQAVARAVAQVGEGRGPAYGSRLHAALKTQVDASPNLRGEVSFLEGEEVRNGTKGSIRVDIIGYKDGKPAVIYDLKSGSARLTPARIARIRGELPPAMQRLPIEEVRP